MNDRSKIIERDIGYQGGIAFGVSEVLLPPGVAGRCDEIKYEQVNVRFIYFRVIRELSSINKVSLV